MSNTATATITNPQQLAQASTTPSGPSTVTITGSSDFSAAVLSELGLPVTQANIAALNAWQAAEGQWTAGGEWNAGANHNPLNLEGTTKGHPDTATGVHYASPTNPINIYGDWSAGILATAQRIAANPGIVNVLRASGGTAALSAAVAQSGWGTGAFGGNSGANQPNTASGDKSATLTVSAGQVGADAVAAVGELIPGLGGLQAALGAGQAAGGGLSTIGTLLTLVLTKRFWMGVLGVGLIVGGGAVFFASTKPGQAAMEIAPSLALAAA